MTDRIEVRDDRYKLIKELTGTGLPEVKAIMRKNKRIEDLKNKIALYKQKVLEMELELCGLEAE